MTTLNRFPNYTEPLTNKGETSRGWYTYWLGISKGQPNAAIAPITRTASPFTYTAAQGGTVVIQGGTVSMVSINRDGINNFNTGQTQGLFPVSQGDSLIVTYTVGPTMMFIPR